MSLSQAKRLISEGDENQARNIIIQEKRKACNDPEMLFQCGLLSEEIGAFDLACHSYEEALRLSPLNSSYLYRLGLIYSDAGRYEKAVRLLTKAVCQDPGHNQPHAP